MQTSRRPDSDPAGVLGPMGPEVATLTRRLAGLLAEIALGAGGDGAAAAIASPPDRGSSPDPRPAITTANVATSPDGTRQAAAGAAGRGSDG
jgi:hypothetical protein